MTTPAADPPDPAFLHRGRRLALGLCFGALVLQLLASVLGTFVLDPPRDHPEIAVGWSVVAVGYLFPYLILLLVSLMLWSGQAWARHVMAIYLGTRITSSLMATLLKILEEPVPVLWWPWLAFHVGALLAGIVLLLRSRSLRAYLEQGAEEPSAAA